MQNIRVACVSMNGFLGEPDRALKNIAACSRQAASQGVELVLFPELVVHGHNAPNTPEVAEAVPDGPSCQRISSLSKEFNLIADALYHAGLGKLLFYFGHGSGGQGRSG